MPEDQRVAKTSRGAGAVRTQVAIVGAGPAGLMLAHLLHRAGIESVVLEAQGRDHVEGRVRAGVLEQGTVDLLVETGVGERLRREGLVHRGIELRFDGGRHRIDLAELAGGRCITVYGQQEVVKDLIAARLGAGGDILFGAEEVSLHGLDGRPTLGRLPPRGCGAPAGVRRRRRLRRLPRRLPSVDPRRGAHPVRARPSLRLAGDPRYLAGDAAHIVPPTGAKGMNLAIADVRVLAPALAELCRTGRTALLDAYSATCLHRVWRAQHFSSWMTTMLHLLPGEDPYGERLQLSQLRYTVSSRAAATSLAENYVGVGLALAPTGRLPYGRPAGGAGGEALAGGRGSAHVWEEEMVSAARRQSLMVGDIRVTYMPDGETRLNPTAFFPASTEEGWKKHPQWLDENGQLLASLGGLLVETGDRKVLVDTGFGPRHAEFPGFGPFDGGKLLPSLAEHGVDPGQIDTVVFTHLHLDHVNAAVRREGDGWQNAFPNTRYLVRDAEWNTWAGKNDPAGMYEETEAGIRDRVDLCDIDTNVAPGVTLVSTPGHTPGHTSVVVSSGTARAIILGDVIHCPVQLDEEEWGCVFDADPALARRTRESMLAELEDSGTVVMCGHFSDFVFGRCLSGQGRRMWTVEKALAGTG